MKAVFLLLLFAALVFSGCSTLALRPGDFAWPIESVQKVNKDGIIEENQYYFSLNVKDLVYSEVQDSVNISNTTIRTIRNSEGYYFITAENFKNVYVFEQIEGGLGLVNKILIKDNGIEKPAFNQRPPYVQLLNGQNPSILLTKDGIVEGENK
jgi:hypothetical protein